MQLEYVPLLQVQRDLYAMPRGFERFREYISTLRNAETGEMELPLGAMNPMGKDHLAVLLDQYLGFEADGLAAAAVAKAATKLGAVAGDFRISMVLSDDLMGSWTNRTFAEFGARFGTKPYFRRGWLAGTLWSSETPTPQRVGEEVLTVVYRGAYIQEHGFAQTLDEMMAQEGHSMAMAGCTAPMLEADDLVYTNEVLSSQRNSTDQSVQIAALYGDQAAKSVGYAALGLSPQAGLALALAESHKRIGR